MEECGDIMEVTEEVWLYIPGWVSCEGWGVSPDMGRLDIDPLERESPLCGLFSMSRPLMLGWSI